MIEERAAGQEGMTGRILEAVEQGRIAVDSLVAALACRTDLTHDEQVSIREAISILEAKQEG